MLLSFAVTNYRSIREWTEVNMLKSGIRGLNNNYFKALSDQYLLKSSVLYGPNNSGKSSFLSSIKALQNFVIGSSSRKPEELISPYEPHRLEKSYAVRPVEFLINFFSDDAQYEYKISFTSKKFELEDLYYYRRGRRSLLYSRILGKEMKYGDYYKGPKKALEKQLLPNQLFLSVAAENNVEVLSPVYRFFKQDLMVFQITEDNHENTLTRLYARRLAEGINSSFSKKFNALICALDTGITSVTAKELVWNDLKVPSNLPAEYKKKIQNDYKYDIKTQHPRFEGNEEIGHEFFDIQEESAGTKSLFVIGGIILEALEKGGVLVIDQFEKTLHPSITQFLIQLSHNQIVNPLNAQLIFATHDIIQLSNDHFRRDQVWVTEKNEFGSTSLVRCSEIPGIRLNTPLDKWYATGRFGATPIINDVDFLLEIQQTRHNED